MITTQMIIEDLQSNANLYSSVETKHGKKAIQRQNKGVLILDDGTLLVPKIVKITPTEKKKLAHLFKQVKN